MIVSFRDDALADLWNGVNSARARKLPTDVRKFGPRKLLLISAAEEVADLRLPPGNNLEALKGDLSGWFSIRVTQQWRFVFRFDEHGAHEVHIGTYKH